jgi:Na+/melibiose symporter-like transporter
MNSKGKSSITPRQGTILIGITLFISSFIAVLIMKFVGRKNLLVFGHFGMAIAHILVAMFNIYEDENVVLAMIIVFLIIY